MSKKVSIVLGIYRLGNKIYYSKIPLNIKKIILKILGFFNLFFGEILFSIEIPFSAKIGKNIRIVHMNGIIINVNAVIGDNCTIMQQVTIGANEHRADYDKVAIIGNNVYIGCGAKIIGNIVIGDNVRIGANAIVTKNVPSNTTVVGINKHIIR